MDYSALRRKDTTKGPPLRILSLDGGGVRGYSMLIILQELMHRTFVEIHGRAPKRDEIPKPCDHFDLIAGNGTGGLIAIMLGRLRLDIDTCKDVYVRMTRRVFETDKTIAGIPYRSTLFKASKLEEAIKECVREHTVFEDEGNDALANAVPMSPDTVGSAASQDGMPQRTFSNASRYSQVGMSPITQRGNLGSTRWGNPNALLYDTRENRTKTAVTAVYKGTPKGGSSVLLRSYDSRKEPAPDVNCTIWQAGRATSANGLAFKPIQIGQSIYIDEGAGKYNPAPQILDEAVQNEWPGRELGVFVSIGTGKRPEGTNNQQHLWWEGFVSGGMGDFAEARRRLINKIEDCENIHQYMLKEHLAKRQANPEHYYRMNVEVGVGEFGLNEWNRLSDISASTRMYLAKNEVQRMNVDAAAKMARIHRAKMRHERVVAGEPIASIEDRWNGPLTSCPPPSNPMPVELPAEDVLPVHQRQASQTLRPPYEHRPSLADQKYTVVSSDEFPQVVDADTMPRRSQDFQYRPSGDNGPRRSDGSITPSPRRSSDSYHQAHSPPPPPLPPKTPLPYPDQLSTGPRTFMNMGSLSRHLPYPDADGPPPPVNMARKPEFGVK
ncbi:hypothetical protein LTR66_012463 [Elasticomyces elasticus]|nr:hypothetical protein LTR66_012463 [Elasticomyces elasticus]KAK4984662.1 hypothetical protein LTR50_006453 [Elasticomyces elasticus]